MHSKFVKNFIIKTCSSWCRVMSLPPLLMTSVVPFPCTMLLQKWQVAVPVAPSNVCCYRCRSMDLSFLLDLILNFCLLYLLKDCRQFYIETRSNGNKTCHLHWSTPKRWLHLNYANRFNCVCIYRCHAKKSKDNSLALTLFLSIGKCWFN